MDFEWDEAKAATNLAKHGFAFEEAAAALMGLELRTTTAFEAEDRFASICNYDGRLVVVVWTQRGLARRLISVRRARKDERERYNQEVRKAAEAR